MRRLLVRLVWSVALLVTAQAEKIDIVSCEASSEGTGQYSSYRTCEYAYEDPDVSSWAVAGSSYIYGAWIQLYLYESSDVATFSYRHRYNHDYDDCTSCLDEANKDIRVSLSNGYSEDFSLLREDGDQYFRLAYVNSDITWVKITVLTVYGDYYANGASDIQIFSDGSTFVGDYVIAEESYSGSYFNGNYYGLTELSLGDDSSVTLVLPTFNFPFFDVLYSSVKLYSNGVLGFVGTHNNDDYISTAGLDLSTNSYFDNYDILAFFWTDLNPSSNGNIYAGSCNEDANIFAIVFANIPLYGYDECTTTIEIMLHSNGNFEIIYVNNQIGVEFDCYSMSPISIGIKGPYTEYSSDFLYAQLYGPSYSGMPVQKHIIFYLFGEDTELPSFLTCSASRDDDVGGGVIIGVVTAVLSCCGLLVYAFLYICKSRKRPDVGPEASGDCRIQPAASAPQAPQLYINSYPNTNTDYGGSYPVQPTYNYSNCSSNNNNNYYSTAYSNEVPLAQAVLVGEGAHYGSPEVMAVMS